MAWVVRFLTLTNRSCLRIFRNCQWEKASSETFLTSIHCSSYIWTIFLDDLAISVRSFPAFHSCGVKTWIWLALLIHFGKTQLQHAVCMHNMMRKITLSNCWYFYNSKFPEINSAFLFSRNIFWTHNPLHDCTVTDSLSPHVAVPLVPFIKANQMLPLCCQRTISHVFQFAQIKELLLRLCSI